MLIRIILRRSFTPHIYLLFILLFTAFSANYLTTKSYAAAEKQYVYDEADILEEREISSLEARAKEVGEKHNTELFIITNTTSNGLSREQYISEFADEAEVNNATILFLSLDPNKRGVDIQRFGKDEQLLTSSKTDDILDKIVPDFKEQSYYKAFQTFLNESDFYLSGKSHTIFSNPVFLIIASLSIGAVVVGIMAYQSSGKVTVHNGTYMDQEHSGITARSDDFIRTTTTKVKKPKDDDGKSGGSSHGTTSGGRSYSNNSRDF